MIDCCRPVKYESFEQTFLSIWKVLSTFHLNPIGAFLFNSFRYHVETSPLICRANQWTGFYMITASVMKELKSKVASPLNEPMDESALSFCIICELTETLYECFTYLRDLFSTLFTKNQCTIVIFWQISVGVTVWDAQVTTFERVLLTMHIRHSCLWALTQNGNGYRNGIFKW